MEFDHAIAECNNPQQQKW